MPLTTRIRAWFIGLSLAWTLLLSFLLYFSLIEQREAIYSFAKSEADVLIKHMMAARSWNATHTGVYVEANEKTPSNPYLHGLVKEQNITTPSGRKLTLVNPAYMTRLINEYFNNIDKRVAHITSLKPIRPENAADPWETKALQSFEQGVKEVAEITNDNGKPVMRLMRPLFVEKACMKCHAAQGYKVGDIRGGITASVPFDKHADYIEHLNIRESVAYASIWLFGLTGFFFGYRRLSTGELKLRMAKKDIHILSASVEQASEAVIITNKDGDIEYVNSSFVRLTGYTKEEAIGKNPRILKSGMHDARFYRGIWKNLAEGKPWQGRIIDQRKDGSCYPVLLTISPIKNDAGEITHYVGSQQDLREYERLEEQFHQAQKMEAIGTLVGGIAHDFNNTLAGITGNLYLVRASAAADPEIDSRLEAIEELSFQAASTIQQLLAFARKDETKTTHPVVVSTFLKDVINVVRIAIPENIELDLKIADEGLIVAGDINQLQQVLVNLINNARDAMEGVRLPCIHIGLHRFVADQSFTDAHPDTTSKEFAHIEISDNGCGIREEYLRHIFEPFFTTKEVGKGTGLGLSMAYGAVQSHDGILEVESQLGKGTTFHIWLPLTGPESTTATTREADTEAVRGEGETILLVDDEATVVETEKAILENLGYSVLTAGDGNEAVQAYQNNSNIDLLLMDVVMPNMSGPEAARVIRSINPDVKIIFATGYDRYNTKLGKQNLQSEIIISKPFSIGQLSRLVRDVLEGKPTASA